MPQEYTFAEQERFEGYLDGTNPNSPEPSTNRSASYRHGFECARADRENRPAFGGYHAALEHCAKAEAEDEMA